MRPFLIGLGGDSGSGKNTLSKMIASVVGEKNLLTISMDGYHKWDREEMKKQTLTHLNPEANNLILALEQTKKLKKNKIVHRVIYDHSTGKFTKPQETAPKKFILIMGLHPYHLKEMRNLFDLKLFAAPDEDIRKKWKVHRDMKKRGYKKEHVLDILAQRKADSVAYIRAQEQYADLVINYFEIGDAQNIHKMELGLSLIFKNNPSLDLKNFKEQLDKTKLSATVEGKTLTLTGKIKGSQIKNIAEKSLLDADIVSKSIKWEDGMKGIFQYICAHEINSKY